MRRRSIIRDVLRRSTLIFAALLLWIVACGDRFQTLEVTATAFTSHPRQTDETPSLTAWGEVLKPGTKAVAVSRDLIDMGLGHGVDIKIHGLPGKYRVVDKMHRRWTKRIDIYMGKDEQGARDWGRRDVTISWPH